MTFSDDTADNGARRDCEKAGGTAGRSTALASTRRCTTIFRSQGKHADTLTPGDDSVRHRALSRRSRIDPNMVRNRVTWCGSSRRVRSTVTLLLLVEVVVNGYRRTTDQKVRDSNPFGALHSGAERRADLGCVQGWERCGWLTVRPNGRVVVLRPLPIGALLGP
jgi:hypothetical protein